MEKKRAESALIALYHHPERFPPTLNAIHELASIYSSISVVFRSTNPSEWNYPEQVRLAGDGQFIESSVQEKLPILQKLLLFSKFALHLRKQLQIQKPGLLLIYDNMALLAYFLIRWSVRRPDVFWYHSHDIPSFAALRKYSISWWAAYFEQRFVHLANIFSLPAIERKNFFQLEKFKGLFFYLPNLPSLAFYQQFYQVKNTPKVVNLIYQGAVNEDHGLEAIIQALPFLNAKLMIIGPCTKEYQEFLLNLAHEHGVSEQVSFLGRIQYQHLPRHTSQGDIGLAILSNMHNSNHITAATASNKIYEYAALGLPVLYYRSSTFTSVLDSYTWTRAIDLNTESIKRAVDDILNHYEQCSIQAHQDFLTGLNFEQVFNPLKIKLQQFTSVDR